MTILCLWLTHISFSFDPFLKLLIGHGENFETFFGLFETLYWTRLSWTCTRRWLYHRSKKLNGNIRVRTRVYSFQHFSYQQKVFVYLILTTSTRYNFFFLANKEKTYFQVSHTLSRFYLDISSKVQRSQSASNLPLQLNEFIDLRKTASAVIQLTVGTIKPFKMERKIENVCCIYI